MVDSFTGNISLGVGAHEPVVNSINLFSSPANTFKSTRELGIPYFVPIPHDVYCQICQSDVQFDLVQEWA